MSRISTPLVASATGAATEVFARIQRAVGSVPNAFIAIAALQPAALNAILDADAVLTSGSLFQKDVETVKLIVSVLIGCNYCIAAHSLLAGLAGLSEGAVRNIRSGLPTGDAKRDAFLPLRLALRHAPYLGGRNPNYADFIGWAAFVAFAPAATTPFLASDDPLQVWVNRGTDLAQQL